MGLSRGAALLVALLAGSSARAGEGTIYVASTAPFTHPSAISRDIVDDCQLPRKQIEALVADARGAGVDLVVSDQAVTAKTGRVLVVEIANAIGNGDRGSEVVLMGRLLDDGVQVADFYASRASLRGFWSGLRTTCAVLQHCQDVLGADIVPWLKSPSPNARLP